MERHVAVGDQVLAVISAHRPLQLDGHQCRLQGTQEVEGRTITSNSLISYYVIIVVEIHTVICLDLVIQWSTSPLTFICPVTQSLNREVKKLTTIQLSNMHVD